MRPSRNLILGLIGGSLLTLLIVFAYQKVGPASKGEVLAELQGEVLTEKGLRDRIGNDLIPIENDEYTVRQRGVEEWIQSRLLEKEAKAQGVALKELYLREIWSKVKVSSQDVQNYYLKNKELFSKPFESIHSLIFKQLRSTEYVRIKDEYLSQLKKKYNAQVLLKKPASYVEGLAIPPQAAGVAAKPAQAQAPSAPLKTPFLTKSLPRRGPQDAPITMVEFVDFHCPFCKRVAPTLEEVFKKYPGQMQWVFRHFPLSKTPGSGSYLTHEAAACADEQGKFWEYYEAIFTLPKAPEELDLSAIAQKVGLNGTRFQECLKNGKQRKQIEEDLAEGARLGVQGTPTVFINDQSVNGAYPLEHFVEVVESALHPEKAKALAAEPEKPKPTVAVQFKDLEDKPSLGPSDAPVTLVEFSDFYCPFCKRVTPTIEELVKNYPGKVRRVWRHYPLPFHTGSDRVHQASECAHEQGKFWAYHDELFKKQGTPFDDAALIKLAKDLSLNKKKFEKCLKSDRYKELVQKEIARGNEVGVQGTPAVFVNGKLVSGAQPYENFDSIVKGELDKS